MGIKYLKAVKKEKKLSNEKISEMSGVPVSTVKRILAETTGKASFASIAAVCDVLGVDISLYSIPDNQIEQKMKEKNAKALGETMSAELPEYDMVQLYRNLDPMGKALASRYMNDLAAMQHVEHSKSPVPASKFPLI